MGRRPSNQDISWFIDLEKRGILNINPPYQRRSVWTRADREYFIDTILNEYPCPPIFLHKTIDDKANGTTTYHVIDGKQRIQTILMFVQDQVRVPKTFSDVRIAGKTWSDIKSVDELARKFWNYSFIIEFIDSVDNAFITEIFDRLNRNGKRLNRQELRYAKYDGWYVSWVEKESSDQFWQNIKAISPSQIRRMLDQQLISELLAVVIDKKIVGFDQEYLDKMHAEYNDADSIEDPSVDDIVQSFNATKAIIGDINGPDGFLKTFGCKANDLYSLWSLVCLEGSRLPTAADTRERLKAFSQQIFEYKIDPAKLSGMPESETIAQYATNSTGASTDLAQRERRHQALRKYFGLE